MEFNANHFQKINDKKILHKIKRQWVVVSLSVLATLGVSALAIHPNAYASGITQLNENDQSRSNYPQLTQKSSSSLRFNLSNQNGRHTYINRQAVNLHRRIIQNSLINNYHTAIYQNHNYSQKQPSLSRMKEVVPMSYEKNDQQSTDLAPLTFHYVNQNGAEVISGSKKEAQISSNGHESISLNKIEKQFPIPTGYTLLPNGNNDRYAFSDQALTYDLHVIGKPMKGTINVEVTTRNIDRKSSEHNYKEPLSGRVGDTIIIQPNGRVLGSKLRYSFYDPKNYYIDPDDNNQIVKFNPNGDIISEDPKGIHFVYDTIGMPAAQKLIGNIHVHYLDYAHHDAEIPNTEISDTNYVNKPYVAAYQKNIPSGYHYLDTLVSTNKFTKSDQNVQVEVAPNYDPDADSNNDQVPKGYVPGWVLNDKGAYYSGYLPSNNIPSDYMPGEIPDNIGGYVLGYVPKDSHYWPAGQNGNSQIPRYVYGKVASGNQHWPSLLGAVPDVSHVNINVNFVDDGKTGRSDTIFQSIIPMTDVKVGSKLSDNQIIYDRIPKGFKVASISPSVVNQAGNYVVHLVQDLPAPQPKPTPEPTVQTGNINLHFEDPSDNFSEYQSVNGYVGSGFKLLSNDKLIPDGYHVDPLDEVANTVYYFAPQTKTITVLLGKNDVQPQRVKVAIYYNDINNNQVVGCRMIDGIVGTVINYVPYIKSPILPDGYVYIKMGNHNLFYQRNGINVIFVKAIPSNSDNIQSNYTHPQQVGTVRIVYINQRGQPVQVKSVSGQSYSLFNVADYEDLNGRQFNRILSNVNHFNSGTQYLVLMNDRSTYQNDEMFSQSNNSISNNSSNYSASSNDNLGYNNSVSSKSENNANVENSQDPNWNSNNGNALPLSNVDNQRMNSASDFGPKHSHSTNRKIINSKSFSRKALNKKRFKKHLAKKK